MNLICPGLYQGDLNSVGQAEDYRITHVLSLCPQRVNLKSGIKHLDLPISDWGLPQPIGKNLENMFDFIDDGINNDGNVLVHCFAGMNRSVSICCAYLMYKHDLTWDQAMEKIKTVCVKADTSKELQNDIVKYFKKLEKY